MGDLDDMRQLRQLTIRPAISVDNVNLARLTYTELEFL
jgi:hypothetical protein